MLWQALIVKHSCFTSTIQATYVLLHVVRLHRPHGLIERLTLPSWVLTFQQSRSNISVLDSCIVLHTVSLSNVSTYVSLLLPLFLCPQSGCHKRTLEASSSLCLQQCPASLIPLSLILSVTFRREPWKWRVFHFAFKIWLPNFWQLVAHYRCLCFPNVDVFEGIINPWSEIF